MSVTILAYLHTHLTLATAIIVVGYLTRIAAPDSKFPITIPVKWLPVVSIVLGQLYGVLVKVQSGASWEVAISNGLTVAFGSMGLAFAFGTAIWGGDEPKWFKTLVFVIQSITQLDVQVKQTEGAVTTTSTIQVKTEDSGSEAKK